MAKKFLKSVLLSVLAATFFISCGSDEREAKNMLIQCQKFLKSTNWVELGNHLDKIIYQYPDTEAAETAKAMRNKMIQRANHIAETILKAALASGTACAMSYPNQPLAMEQLREFGYKGMDGVEVEIVRDEPDDFLITSAHVVGDRVYSVGTDGYIEYDSK